MSLEDRIRNELHDTAETLALDPGEYRRAIEAAARRRQRRLLGAGVASAGVVVALAAAALLLRPGDQPSVAASTTAASQTTAFPPQTTAGVVSDLGPAILVAGVDGVIYGPLDAGGTGRLSSDPYYESIAWVIGDGAGGIVFTHEVTPLPWDQGTLLWLPARETNPRPIATPPAQSLITPIGVDAGRVYYRLDPGGMSEIVAVDLDGQNSQVVVPATPELLAVSMSGSVVAVAQGIDCTEIALYMGVDGTQMPDRFPDCYPASITDIGLVGDLLFVLEEGSFLRKMSIAGDDLGVSAIEGWQVEALSSNQVAVGGNALSVGSFTGASFEPGTQVTNPGTFALVDSLSIASNATLGSGLGEWPCTPLDVPAPLAQAVPEVVNEKRAQIFSLAASCDLAGLAEIVLADGARFNFGDEVDPIRFWVREARYGHDPMSMTVRMFNAEPAQDDQGAWAWPAVHATGSEEDWEALSGVLSAAEFEQFYEFRDSGYLGFRIGIDPDGRLSYLVAGD